MRQLHASDSQGVERKREVVVRPDGSKVIRVEKRRRTYNDDHGDAKQAVLKNKRFLIGLCILVLLVVGALAGTYMYRLTSFNTEEFAGRLQSDLSAAWGGKVEASGMAMDGLSMKAARHQGHFPAGFLPVFCNDGRRFRRNLRHVPVHGKNQGGKPEHGQGHDWPASRILQICRAADEAGTPVRLPAVHLSAPGGRLRPQDGGTYPGAE